jgi:hypothetical protein
MEAAASTAHDVHTENGVEHSNASRTLRPLLKAVEMVFGSAAALSATFGYRVRSLLWRIRTYQAPLQSARRQGHCLSSCMHKQGLVWPCLEASFGPSRYLSGLLCLAECCGMEGWY